MAINRYDVPSQDRYFNTYVDLPYEQLMGTVAARQGQLDKAQDALTNMYADTQNLQYIPGSKDEEFVRNYVTGVSDLVGKYYMQDMSDPVVANQLRSEFNKMTNRQALQNIQMSKAAWDATNKVRTALQAEGTYDPLLDEDPAEGWDTVGSGKVYNYNVSPYKNPRPAAEPYFNNIKASYLGDDGSKWYQGVTSDKIKEVANTRWGDFSDTPEGKQYIKKIAKQRGLDPTNSDIRRQIATEYLLDVGKEYIYKDMGGFLPEGMRKTSGEDDDSGGYLNTTQIQPLRTDKTFDPLGIGTLKFKGNGELDAINSIARPTEWSGAYGNVLNVSEEQTIEGANKIANEKVKLIKDKFPQLANLSNKEAYDAYRQLIKDGKAFPDLPVLDLPQVARENLANFLGNSMTNRTVMVMDDRGQSDLRLFNDDTENSPMADLGYSPQEFRQELKKAAKNDPESLVTVGGMAQNGPQAGMLQLEVYDKSRKGGKGSKGALRKVYVSMNDQFGNIMSPLNEVYENIRNFKEGITPVGYDSNGNMIAAKVTPNVYKNENTGEWEYDWKLEQGYVTEDGFDSKGDIPIGYIENMQLNQLKKSKLINSRIDYTRNTEPSF